MHRIERPAYIHRFALWGIPLALFAFPAWGLADLMTQRPATMLAVRVLGFGLLGTGLVLIAMAMIRTGQMQIHLKRLGAGVCPRCKYDLRATPDQCPECGMMVGEEDRSQ